MRAGACVVSLGLALVAGAACGQIATDPFVSGVLRPVYMVADPSEPTRLFVVEQRGAIRVINNGVLETTEFLDIDPMVTGGTSGNSEQGMLGLAFAPDYATSGRFFVNYIGTVAGQSGTHTIVAEYTRSADPNVANTTERRILTIAQPFSNHNGGWMDFGPDGYLYICAGDGGSGNDPQNNASRLVNLLGKLLRIDVSDDMTTYTIPPTNPFVGVAGAREEIWAYGLRNPWRTSFDMLTGDLWIADVGQDTREEINFQPASSAGGEHYGWRCREGIIENPSFSGCTASLPPGVVGPVYDYAQAGGRCSVTGGYLYRGCAVPELDGKYVFGDYCTGEIWTLDPSNGNAVALVGNEGFGLSSFAQDAEGELYVMDLFGGTIEKLVSVNVVDTDGDTIPDTCEVECVADTNGDGMVTPADFGAWITAFNASAPECDQNGDGMCTPADFGAWITNFNAGC